MEERDILLLKEPKDFFRIPVFGSRYNSNEESMRIRIYHSAHLPPLDLWLVIYACTGVSQIAFEAEIQMY